MRTIRTYTTDDLERVRRMSRETDSILGLTQALCDDDDNLPSRELQDRLDEMVDAIIEFRCALESAFYEGTDHFDQEA